MRGAALLRSRDAVSPPPRVGPWPGARARRRRPERRRARLRPPDDPEDPAAAVGPVHTERPSAAAASPCRRARGGRRAVGDALAPPRRPRRTTRMGHLGRGVVANPPSVIVEAPHQVDVLAVAQPGVEAADRFERVGEPCHERGRGHVGDGGTRPDRGRARAPVERRAHRLVAGEQRRRRAGCGPHPGGDRAEGRVVEVGEEPGEPLGIGVDLCVDEGHDREVGGPPTLSRAAAGPVARRLRDTAHRRLRVRRRPRRSHLVGIARPVVDHHDLADRWDRTQCGAQAVGHVAHGHHRGDVARRGAGAGDRPGMGETGVDESTGERPLAGVVGAGCPGPSRATKSAPPRE